MHFRYGACENAGELDTDKMAENKQKSTKNESVLKYENANAIFPISYFRMFWFFFDLFFTNNKLMNIIFL